MRQIPDSKQLVALMLTAIRMSIQAELDVFFGHLQDRSQLARTVSEQAFAQARAKQDVAAKIMCDNLQTLATLTAGDQADPRRRPHQSCLRPHRAQTLDAGSASRQEGRQALA
jgi:hypothetical protein